MWKDNLTIVLVETRNPLNIGAAARAMLNFGFRRLALVAPYDVAFQEARSAVGAASVLQKAQVSPSLEEAIADCTLVIGTGTLEGRVRRQPRRLLPEVAVLMRRHLARQRAALLFGSEKFGLSNAHLSHCQWILHIPTNPLCPSMNLGQAVALCCWELAREKPRRAATARAPARPAAAQLERIVQRLIAALDASGYIPARTRASQVLKIERLVRRLELSRQDAQVVEGMLRQIGWKLGEGARGREP